MKIIDSTDPKPEPGPLVGGVIVTHGHLGSEFLAAAEMIVGPIAHVTAASIEWHDDVEVAREEVRDELVRPVLGPFADGRRLRLHGVAPDPVPRSDAWRATLRLPSDSHG